MSKKTHQTEVRPAAPPAEYPGVVPIHEIKESPFQPRTEYRPEALEDLANSIREHGIIQPPVVRPIGGKWIAKDNAWECDVWEIVCGHRRVRAARIAGLEEIAVIVRPLTDEQVRVFQDIENAKRDNISVTDRAAAMVALKELGLTVEKIAALTSTSESVVRELILLDRMPTDLAAAVNAGTVSPSAAAMVCRIPDLGKQAEAARTVVDGSYTKEQTANLIASRYQRELKSAPFPTKGEAAKRFALTMGIPDVGCDSCPERAGNRTDEVYKKLRADTCLDTACYARREAAWHKAHPKPTLAVPKPKPPAPVETDDASGYTKRIAVEAAKRAFEKLKGGTDASSKILGHSDRLVAYLIHDTFADDYTLTAAMKAIAGLNPGDWLEDAETPQVRAFSAAVAVASIAVNHPVASELPIGKTFAGLVGVDPDKFREQVRADVDAERATNSKSKPTKPRKGAA